MVDQERHPFKTLDLSIYPGRSQFDGCPYVTEPTRGQQSPAAAEP